MRGHPLTRRSLLLLGIPLAAIVLVGMAARLTASSMPSDAVAVTVTTAPGETLAFRPAETVVEAPGPIVITFRNDSSLPHNLVFTGGLTGSTRTIVEPGTSDRVTIAPAAPGSYPFACTIHMEMAGVLTVLDR